MKFNVDTKIDINFTEDQIKQILTETVQAEMPNVSVNDILFVIKRNPTNISASVIAEMVGFENKSAEVGETQTEPLKGETNEESTGETEKVSDFLDLD